MNERDIAQLRAIEEIKQAKARYFRGVDTGDSELVRGILAPDCVLDYNGCCTDPVTGQDFLPTMNMVLKGSASWSSKGFAKAGIVSVHQGYNFDITFVDDVTAEVICAMTDRLFMPPAAPFSVLTGYGHYHETYVNRGDGWKIRALRLVRLRVEAA